MKQLMLAGLAGVVLAASSRAQDEATLGVGDPAPSLTVAEWVKGPQVPAFAAGQVYLVEFWATW